MPEGHKGNFKDDTWELYYLPDDFSEASDLAGKESDKLAEMQHLFDQVAQEFNVYPLDDRESFELIAAKNKALGGEKTHHLPLMTPLKR